mmetsp:Transcript_5763/g.9819  ORF Transcript_5763/g.9819 Transcript_5763/m.9819 type:complete len:164 (+) Transcript_5763:86-577(+)|eukprot:CAMPEP_0168593420 /NCGR_PEP_ID=MMETSP0420-20121227/8305_1 /TAXON_ID=498008 /ORGANISM="Pessonella sp." /LENGTH=163 /DNA_ID=CAMNT_0008629571 /DNA_START=49 /DNA_END=540 /DNA_ORIENTATION=+
MPSSFGYRARTRDLFSKGFREKGMPNLSTYLKTYRLGDIVDIKANAAIQKGMPHKFYHGKTGTVFNVTPRAIGVIVNKRVNTRIIPKRIHVRVEHVSHSKCRLDFLNRVKENEAKRAAARKSGKPLTAGALRRLPRQPARGFLVSAKKTEVLTIRPLPHVNMV